MTKRILSITMCVMLLLSVLSIAASAMGETYYMEAIESVKTHDLDGKSTAPNRNTKTAIIPRYSSGLPEAYRFYSTLDKYQKAFYDVIVNDKAGLYKADASEHEATLSAVTLTVPENEFDDVWLNEGLNKIIYGAWSAFSEDYPEYFWPKLCGASYYTPRYSNGNYIITMFPTVDIIDSNKETHPYTTWGEVRNYYNGLIQAVDNFRAVGGNRYQLLKSINDQICKTVSYDYEFDNPIAYEPISVFFAPFEPVCEGYAEAFKLICDKYGIPCIGVSGIGATTNGSGPHKWNYVQMEDGKWYGMDVTWNDGASLNYDYFLVGSETKSAFHGQQTFTNDHIVTGEGFGQYVLSYPTLSTTSYSLAVPNINSTLSFDAANNRVYFGKGVTLKTEFFALCNYLSPTQISGQTVTVSGTTTGATVTVENGGLTKVYNAVRRGDVDADNSVNSNDYSRMKNTVSGSGSGLTENTAGYWAGDFDDDGSLDAFDLYYMDMYLNGNIDY